MGVFACSKLTIVILSLSPSLGHNHHTARKSRSCIPANRLVGDNPSDSSACSLGVFSQSYRHHVAETSHPLYARLNSCPRETRKNGEWLILCKPLSFGVICLLFHKKCWILFSNFLSSGPEAGLPGHPSGLQDCKDTGLDMCLSGGSSPCYELLSSEALSSSTRLEAWLMQQRSQSKIRFIKPWSCWACSWLCSTLCSHSWTSPVRLVLLLALPAFDR